MINMHKYNLNKKWLIRLGLSVAGLMALLSGFNYAIDPLWCFSHANWFTSFRKPFNERQQKTNYLTFVNARKYDALIIGNSRTSLVNQNDFSGVQAYNYAVAGMTPYEYRDYIDYFKLVAGSPRIIFLGIDFQNTNQELKFVQDKPEKYINRVQSPFYRFKLLITRDAFAYSRENLGIKKLMRKNKLDGGFILYKQDNVATLIKPEDESGRQDYIKREVANLREAYRKNYTYRNDLAKFMKELIQSNPGTRFIPFTSPVSKLYFCAMVKEGRFPQYERWLREMVEVFGQVWHFEYLNSITMDYDKNYSDSQHFYTPVGTLLAHRVTGVIDPLIPADFGILLTSENIDEQLAKIKSDSAACR